MGITQKIPSGGRAAHQKIWWYVLSGTVLRPSLRIVQYLRWSSEPEYQAGINDPIWDDLAARAFYGVRHTGGRGGRRP